jgi:phospholipid/cholesterol/gamma-HCH transport system ATP-binding protein
MIIDDLIYEITHEFNITTIINSHDMNSVMEIGEKIIYIEKGVKAWEGTKDEIFDAENESFNNFVFASKLFKQLKMLKQNPY